MPQRSFYDSEGEPIEQKKFTPIEEFPDARDNPLEALIAKQTEVQASEDESGLTDQDHWELDQRDDDFIPPKETGYTLHDFQMNAAHFAGERKDVKEISQAERLDLIQQEIDRQLVIRKLKELSMDDEFSSLSRSDGHRGPEVPNKHLKGLDTIRRAA